MIGFKLKSNREQVMIAFEQSIEKALDECGLQAQNYAVMNIEEPKPHKNGIVRPNVDTGNLAGSIDHQPEGSRTEVIGTNVEYAVYVEMGTQKTLSYPFLRPAVVDHASEYEDIVRENLQNA